MSSDKSIPHLILDFIRDEGLVKGSHLPAQALADRFNVSRSPVNDALAFFESKGLLRREPNRGYFLAKPIDAKSEKKLGIAQGDAVSATYFRMADDVLKGSLPLEVTESFIKNKYELTAAQLKAVLTRIANEGWAQRKAGYGWEFSTMLTTPDSLLQSYRLRLALEPAALLEPSYHLSPEVLEKCRAAEHHLLDGGIEIDTPDQLHERGVRFHESLVEASGNPFFIDTIRRVNRVRRLISYRSMQDRKRYTEHCQQHLQVLDLIAKGKRVDAAEMMRKHLQRTLENHQKIRRLLNP
jgi:DNA-binding GntR family transcriptional regulator